MTSPLAAKVTSNRCTVYEMGEKQKQFSRQMLSPVYRIASLLLRLQWCQLWCYISFSLPRLSSPVLPPVRGTISWIEYVRFLPLLIQILPKDPQPNIPSLFCCICRELSTLVFGNSLREVRVRSGKDKEKNPNPLILYSPLSLLVHCISWMSTSQTITLLSFYLCIYMTPSQ